MGSEADCEANSTPKLSLFSFPSNPPEPTGTLTPPPRIQASVPFRWEEAPGKPRPCTKTTTESSSKPKCARSLELPPRLLLSESKMTKTPSPTTVLDGPYVGRSISFRFSLRSPEALVGKKLAKDKGGSMRWGSFRKTKEVVEGIFDFSSYPVVDSGGGGGGGGDTKMKITRVKKRSGSFSNLSHTKPPFLANIYESLKQAVPWRRRQERLRKRDSQSVTF
ncbi:uncharacterized protein At4g00950 isoform X1 [Quercus suber]|uniref:Uncharacterized protein n=1 Tax=Quercus suber TaxID=58331 RepID=A0AAW0JNN7_QUESU|nr:uncharacterized protein At4g00950 [Quercus suber]POE97146.1 uncharacterized protein CFP56_19999 [Quercus suber]